jgi:hypothetical protein
LLVSEAWFFLQRTLPISKKLRQLCTLFGVCILLTVSIAVATCLIQNRFCSHYPYFYDPVAYQVRIASVYEDLVQHGQLNAFIHEATSNGIFPFRTLPLILVAPDLLSHPYGHFATLLPLFFSFICILGYTVYRRSNSVIYAIASIVLACSLPGIYSPRYGLGTLWLDCAASFAVGCAALSALNFVQTERIGWLLSLSIFVAIATQSRYIAIVYILISVYPIVFCALLSRARKHGFNAIKTSVQVGIGVPLVLAGPFLIGHAPKTYDYYTTYGYGLHHPISLCAATMSNFIIEHLMPLQSWLLVAIVATHNVVRSLQAKRELLDNLLCQLWMPVSFLVFFICVLRSYENGYVMWYLLPLVIVFATVPFAEFKPNKWMTMLSVFTIVFSVWTGISAMTHGYHLAKRPPTDQIQLDKAIATALIPYGTGVTWCAFFDEYLSMPSAEAFYRTKALPHGLTHLYTVHEAFWNGYYPKLDSAAKVLIVKTKALKKLKVAIVCEDPNAAFSARMPSRGPTAQLVAYEMAKWLKEEPSWRFVGHIDDPTHRYGTLSVYENLAFAKNFSPQLEDEDKY